jgi:glycosyltransferase involved in cell wall biosynthesis
MRLAYPVLWSRLGRAASQEQSVRTASALAEAGADVTLILPRGNEDPALSAAAVADWFGTRGGFDLVQRRSRWAGESLWRSGRWFRQLAAAGAFDGFDLVYSRAPLMLVAGQISPRPFVTEQYRPWPDQWPFVRPLVRRTAASRLFLGLILHSEFAAESYRRAGVSGGHILVAHNGAGIDPPDRDLSREAARARLELPADRAIAVYAGRINARKGLDQLLALADLRPEVLFLLVGSEGDGAVEAEARRRGNVEVLPWQGPATLPAFLRAADVLVIPPSSVPLARFGDCVLPLKTFAYLAAGRPILAPISPDTAELLRDGDNAALVPPDRPHAAAAALDRMLGDAAYAARLASGAAETARGLGWPERARRIIGFLERRLAQVSA